MINQLTFPTLGVIKVTKTIFMFVIRKKILGNFSEYFFEPRDWIQDQKRVSSILEIWCVKRY